MKEPESSPLWTFQSEPDPEFKQPSGRELLACWREHHSATKRAFLLENHFGVCEVPERAPTAFVSLDLCEVVRETAISLTRIRGGGLSDIVTNSEGTNSDYGMTFLGADTFSPRVNVTQIILWHLMNEKAPNNEEDQKFKPPLITPVPHASTIRSLMQRWREQGVYIVANTSTLPGCEKGTIKSLNDHYAGTTQGILFPRNHDGRGVATKAGILEEAKEIMEWHTGFDLTNAPTIAIEDTPHHAQGYIARDPEAQVFMPEYEWNRAVKDAPNITRVEQGLGTVDTFVVVDKHLRERGIIK